MLQRFANGATAVAFERAFGSRWIVNIILLAALLSLVKIFNGNFIAASRLLYALGRNGMIRARTGEVHPVYRTPCIAVIGLGVLTAAAVFLGDAILVPISEVGSLASIVGWFAACSAYFYIATEVRQRGIAAVGGLMAVLLMGMKVLPFVPGHFTRYEWLALGLWLAAGAALRRGVAPAVAGAGEEA